MVEFYSDIVVRVAVLFFALWAGGISTTLYGRLPTDTPIGPDHKPMCDHCGKRISFKYFIPVIGYFLSNGKCVHCQQKIPRIYLCIELVITAYIMLLSFRFNDFDEVFITKALFCAYLITLLFIYRTHRQIKVRFIWILASCILAYRGYSGNLPNLIDLFICFIIAYLAFSIYEKYIKLEKIEFIMCVMLVMQLGFIVAIVFFLSSLIFVFLHNYVFKNSNVYKLETHHIVELPIYSSLVLAFII